MKYSQKTADLIERMCRNVEREDFDLNKEKAEELILKTYDIFQLKRPKKIVWCVDIFDKKFAGSAGSARSAGSMGSALDYDFDWYIFEFEYYQNPNKNKLPNENDIKYLEYCELLMQAKEAGLGYRVEWEDTLYLVPTPLVRIDKHNRFHSLAEPAIRWKNGEEFYCIAGVEIEKEKWNKIQQKTLSKEDILHEPNAEVRRIMMEQLGNQRFVEICHPTTIHEDEYGKLLKIELKSDEPWIGIRVQDASVDKKYILRVPPAMKTCHEAIAWTFGFNDSKNYIPIEQA